MFSHLLNCFKKSFRSASNLRSCQNSYNSVSFSQILPKSTRNQSEIDPKILPNPPQGLQKPTPEAPKSTPEAPEGPKRCPRGSFNDMSEPLGIILR